MLRQFIILVTLLVLVKGSKMVLDITHLPAFYRLIHPDKADSFTFDIAINPNASFNASKPLQYPLKFVMGTENKTDCGYSFLLFPLDATQWVIQGFTSKSLMINLGEKITIRYERDVVKINNSDGLELLCKLEWAQFNGTHDALDLMIFLENGPKLEGVDCFTFELDELIKIEPVYAYIPTGKPSSPSASSTTRTVSKGPESSKDSDTTEPAASAGLGTGSYIGIGAGALIIGIVLGLGSMAAFLYLRKKNRDKKGAYPVAQPQASTPLRRTTHGMEDDETVTQPPLNSQKKGKAGKKKRAA